MSVGGENLEAVVKAIDYHNQTCRAGRAVAILMHPVEIERMGHDPGDSIYSCELRADPTVGTGTFRLVCAAEETDAGDELEATMLEDQVGVA